MDDETLPPLPPANGLTYARLRQVLSYDPETGYFTRIGAQLRHSKPFTPTAINPMANSTGYCTFSVDGRDYKAHRVAWLYMTGEWPKGHIDHIDGDKTNNRFENLRDVNNQWNMQNLRQPFRTNKSGFLGVQFVKEGVLKPWKAKIKVDGRSINVGFYATPEEAHQGYLEAKKRLHPGYVNVETRNG